jgi:hypothetical protein
VWHEFSLKRAGKGARKIWEFREFRFRFQISDLEGGREIVEMVVNMGIDFIDFTEIC